MTTTSHLRRTPTPPTGRTTHDWRQLQLITAQPVQVDNVLIELAPLLHAIGQTGPGCWWIRKNDTVRLPRGSTRSGTVHRSAPRHLARRR